MKHTKQTPEERARRTQADLSMGRSSEPHTTHGACSDCEGQGFIATDGGSGLERCDECKVFLDDDTALAAALVLASRAIADPSLPRDGVRFDKLVAALAVAHQRLTDHE